MANNLSFSMKNFSQTVNLAGLVLIEIAAWKTMVQDKKKDKMFVHNENWNKKVDNSCCHDIHTSALLLFTLFVFLLKQSGFSLDVLNNNTF